MLSDGVLGLHVFDVSCAATLGEPRHSPAHTMPPSQIADIVPKGNLELLHFSSRGESH